MSAESISVTEIIIVAFAVLIVGAIFMALFRIRKERTVPDIEELEGHDFEYYCADLLRCDHFQNVEVTKGSGDYGVDILAEKDGITYAIQCKRYSKPVGVKAVQEAYAGRDMYDRMVGVVMTNQFFTTPAVEAAKKLKILLWDGGYIAEMEGR